MNVIRYMSLLLNRGKLLSDRMLFGRWGERRCERYLRNKGLAKLARNFSCKTGELDLVMVDADGTIVFVEVKTRADESFTQTEEAVTAAKKLRLIRAARYFLKINDIEDRPCRFDIVTLVSSDAGSEQIRHYENAFVP